MKCIISDKEKWVVYPNQVYMPSLPNFVGKATRANRLQSLKHQL